MPILAASVPRSPYQAGDPFPAVMDLRAVAVAINVSYSRARHLQADGQLQELETATRIGNRIRYSGAKVQQWAEGSPALAAASTAGRRQWGGSR